jgi:hypothetical protein
MIPPALHARIPECAMLWCSMLVPAPARHTSRGAAHALCIGHAARMNPAVPLAGSWAVEQPSAMRRWTWRAVSTTALVQRKALGWRRRYPSCRSSARLRYGGPGSRLCSASPWSLRWTGGPSAAMRIRTTVPPQCTSAVPACRPNTASTATARTMRWLACTGSTETFSTRPPCS